MILRSCLHAVHAPDRVERVDARLHRRPDDADHVPIACASNVWMKYDELFFFFAGIRQGSPEEAENIS